MHCVMVFPWQWGAQVEKVVVVEGGGGQMGHGTEVSILDVWSV